MNSIIAFFKKNWIVLLSLGFGGFFWLFDAFVDVSFFHKGAFLSVLDALVGISPYFIGYHELYMRAAFVVMMFIFGLILSSRMKKQKRNEKTLREQKKIITSVFRASPDFMCVLDRKGRVLESNWHGDWISKEIIRKRNTRCWEIYGRKEKCKNCIMDKVIEEKKPIRKQITIKNGRKRLFEVTAFPIFHNGHEEEVEFIAEHYRDITDKVESEKRQKLFEKQIAHNKKLDALGQMAGGIAHNFNNLLMGITGYITIMEYDESVRKAHGDKLQAITEQIHSASDLTKSLLGFARGGKYVVKIYSLNDIIESACSMFIQTKREVTVHKRLSPNLWKTEVDGNQLEQVLINLFINSWQAMMGLSTKEIFIETKNIEVDEEFIKQHGVDRKPGKYVKLSVTDTGRGIPEEELPYIFDPFYTTKGSVGSGMGLASAYGIIENHQGIISAYSKNSGATFCIYLPAREDINGEHLSTEKPRKKIFGNQELILVIDDEDFVTSANVKMLELLNYKVITADNGFDGIDLFKQHQKNISLVILDLIMPKMSGGEVYDVLREIDPKIPIILSSGYSLNGDAKDIIDRGCNGFMQKPFTLDEMCLEVARVLNKDK